MRLRIYDFLLDGNRIKDMPAIDGEQHCCRSNIYHGPRPDDLRCTCAKILFPQILAVNKTVFAEAAPVLYANTELRIALPTYHQPYDIDTILDVLSDEAKASITSAVLPTSLNEIDIVVYKNDQPSNSMTSLWTKLAVGFPRLKNIRLQMKFNLAFLTNLEPIGWQQLTGVLSLPGIESLDVEILHFTDDEMIAGMDEKFATNLDAHLRAQMSRLGKSIKILSFGEEGKITPREF